MEKCCLAFIQINYKFKDVFMQISNPVNYSYWKKKKGVRHWAIWK
jgi:hypothetical protein